MSVVKIDPMFLRHSKKPFTTIFTSVLQNIQDGFTLGLFCYLSSLPPDWNVNSIHLQKHFGVGKYKIKQAMSWLNKNNLIRYIQEKDEKGLWIKSYIEVQDGVQFIENINNNQHHKDDATGGSKIGRPDYRATRKLAPTNKTNNKNKNKIQRGTKKNKSALSNFFNFNPDESIVNLCENLGLNLDEEMKSFKYRHYGEKSQYEFERWIKSSFEYKERKKILSISKHLHEPRQTAKFFFDYTKPCEATGRYQVNEKM